MAKKKSKGPRMSLAALIGLLATACVVVGIAVFALQSYRGHEDVWLHFRRGTLSHQSVRDSLKARLGTTMGMKTYILWRLQGSDTARLRGAYRVERGTTALGLSRRMAGGRQTPVDISFNNLRSVEDLARRMALLFDFTPEDFLHACDSILKPKGFSRAEYPAMFMPDTYNFYATTSAPNLVARLVESRNSFWTPERMAAASREGLTPVEVSTLASIVEEETAKRDEYPRIARLYLNRLHKGMRLQADPTAKFASGNFAARRITLDMLRTPSPYNTYLHTGLPPGPIRIPDRRSIDAVLNSPAHNFLYMCAREDFSGYHRFATDYATHLRNAALYREALDHRGIH